MKMQCLSDEGVLDCKYFPLSKGGKIAFLCVKIHSNLFFKGGGISEIASL
jgi:hypothetical protein